MNELGYYRAFLQTRTLRNPPPPQTPWVEVGFLPLRDSFGDRILIPAHSAEEALRIVKKEHPHFSLIAVSPDHV